jgi:putative Ca2+/H+ antiporter (TMEM165/GDT1 family)
MAVRLLTMRGLYVSMILASGRGRAAVFTGSAAAIATMHVIA